jgi:hypothetical protein
VRFETFAAICRPLDVAMLEGEAGRDDIGG